MLVFIILIFTLTVSMQQNEARRQLLQQTYLANLDRRLVNDQ